MTLQGTDPAPDRFVAEMQRGLQLLQTGRLDEAAELYRQIIRLDPHHPEANNLLGIVLHRSGRSGEGVAFVSTAVEHQPFNATYHANLAALSEAAGQLKEAVQSYERALQIRPDAPRVQSDLGAVLFKQNRFEEAAAAQRQALAMAPGLAVAQSRLSGALIELRQLDEARAAAERSVQLDPRSADSHHALGRAWLARRQPLEAARSLREAARLRPDSAICTDFARSLRILGKTQEAIAIYEAAIATDRENVILLKEFMDLLVEAQQSERGGQLLAKLAALEPESADEQLQLALVLLENGMTDEADLHLKRALELAPAHLSALGSRLFVVNYQPDYPLADAVSLTVEFGRHAVSQHKPRTQFSNEPRIDRRLRVGLVSGDFVRHPVGRFTASTLAAIDPQQIELFAYYTSPLRDSFTDAIERSIPNWRDVATDDEDKLEARILEDRIDILVDLSGHTAGNRLGVFARKPAPVQVTWLGFFATTGLPTIDYVFSTPWVIPSAEQWQWVEKPWHLPETYLCFTPPEVEVAVRPLPALASGRITFGSANVINKLNDRTMQCWAAVLEAVADSQLVLRSRGVSNDKVANAVRARFSAHGIASDRLILLPGEREYARHLDRYNEIDIALDPFPYAGGTTTVEALWMGVPVLTLKGDRYVAHMGENILHNVGLADWIAEDLDAYVRKAQTFAADRDGLSALRQQLRPRLSASPMMDAPRFARNLEAAFRGMWQTWCANQSPR